MKNAIPMTGSSTITVVDPELEKFRATLARLWEKTLASGKVKIRGEGAFIRRDRGSTGSLSPETAVAIAEFRQELNAISAPFEPAPAEN